MPLASDLSSSPLGSPTSPLSPKPQSRHSPEKQPLTAGLPLNAPTDLPQWPLGPALIAPEPATVTVPSSAAVSLGPAKRRISWAPEAKVGLTIAVGVTQKEKQNKQL